MKNKPAAMLCELHGKSLPEPLQTAVETLKFLESYTTWLIILAEWLLIPLALLLVFKPAFRQFIKSLWQRKATPVLLWILTATFSMGVIIFMLIAHIQLNQALIGCP